MIYKIKLFDEEFLLIGTKNDGAIAKKEQYDNFELGYAHLFPNGQIKRFNKIIGHRDQIEFIGEVSE